jgi:hypothetical protein
MARLRGTVLQQEARQGQIVGFAFPVEAAKLGPRVPRHLSVAGVGAGVSLDLPAQFQDVEHQAAFILGQRRFPQGAHDVRIKRRKPVFENLGRGTEALLLGSQPFQYPKLAGQ